MQLLPLIQNAFYDVSLIFPMSFWVFDILTVLTELFFIDFFFNCNCKTSSPSYVNEFIVDQP